MSRLRLRPADRPRRRAVVALCVAGLMVGSLATDVALSAQAVSGAAPAADAAKKRKKKKCKKGYKLVTVKVKRKKRGKKVTVKVKKCRKIKRKKATPPVVVPAPKPVPGPGPGPAAAAPKIDQVLGWSTLAQDPDTPPADLVADGGTITTCTTTNSLSVYIRRSGVTSVGQLSHTWKRDGAVIASGSNTSTYNGAFRYGITINPVNGVYEIVWSVGGTTIGSAKVTRSC